MHNINIHSIYSALEGEGVDIGIPTTLVRFQGCAVGCKNCDTPDSWNRNVGTLYTPEAIFDIVKELPARRVSITGGDIALQLTGLNKLMSLLQGYGFTTNLELTGQSYLDFTGFNPSLTYLSIDIKPPSTGVTPNVTAIARYLRDAVIHKQIKIVVADEKDLLFALESVAYLVGEFPDAQFIITPCYTTKQDSFNFPVIKATIDKVIASGLPIRVILQQHKVVYGSKERLV